MSRALKATTSTPNTLLSSRDHYAALVMGFPELEFSPSEVLVWPRAEPLQSRGEQRSAYSAVSALHKKYEDPSKNMVMLRESCQVVRPVSYSELPEASKKQLQGPSTVYHTKQDVRQQDKPAQATAELSGEDYQPHHNQD